MRTASLFLCVSLVVAGCGGEKKKTSGGGSAPAANGKTGGSGGAATKAAPDPAAIEAAKQAIASAKAEIADLEKAAGELAERHKQELAALPNKDKIEQVRRGFSQLRRDAIRSADHLARSEKRLAELKQAAESSAAGVVKELKEKEAEIEKRREEANRGWRKVREEEAHGAVSESPVKRDLLAVRVLKQKWFEATPDARRGSVTSDRKQEINGAFRVWIKGDPSRGSICAKVLAQEMAPKGKTPDSYDFTDLDFFVLLEVYENELDKLNIVVEKKEAQKQEAVVDAIDAELDKLREQIRAAMQKGGPELEEYNDLAERIGDARDLDQTIQAKYMVNKQIVEQMSDLRDRQREEQQAADDALAAAKKKLAEAQSLSR